jgi:hypothetical protein
MSYSTSAEANYSHEVCDQRNIPQEWRYICTQKFDVKIENPFSSVDARAMGFEGRMIVIPDEYPHIAEELIRKGLVVRAHDKNKEE